MVAFSSKSLRYLAPQVGLEPTTLRLTAKNPLLILLTPAKLPIVKNVICQVNLPFFGSYVYLDLLGYTKMLKGELKGRSSKPLDRLNLKQKPT
jgi:hypothetical protein